MDVKESYHMETQHLYSTISDKSIPHIVNLRVTMLDVTRVINLQWTI